MLEFPSRALGRREGGGGEGEGVDVNPSLSRGVPPRLPNPDPVYTFMTNILQFPYPVYDMNLKEDKL